jgi:hypothetical protein
MNRGHSLVLTSSLLLACAAGCVHSATESECQMILEKNVEIALRGTDKVDPVTFAKKKLEYQAEFGAELKNCVGKRVTTSVVACIQTAQTDADLKKCGR